MASTIRDIPSPYIPAQPYSSGVNAVSRGLANQLDYTLLVNLQAPTSHDFPSGYFACGDFFKSLGEQSFCSTYSLGEWHYDERRVAQMILPFLYLGPTSAARNVNFLREKGITHMVGIRGTMHHHPLIVNADKAATELGIKADYVTVEEEYQLNQLFPDIIRRINEHLCCCPVHHQRDITMPKKTDGRSGPPKKVLVFCETGNERSATVAVAYLMAMLGCDLRSAWINVQGRRLCCNLSDALKFELQTFDTILKAKRDVTRAMSQTGVLKDASNGTGKSSPKKRAIDSMRDFENQEAFSADIDMLSCLDEERFSSRSRQPPFSDAI
ncbi:hypothetical protein AJ79_06567 [Helicocarpus griseus UAMH5409]|uniref:Tyrosine specific protein phosphatases domain-containing protein n=1 Tax=Helicocarpus griseus UAMH5409 TaxID=1447875 RepID=A0A2B7X3U8_9EURO|nr:hypothetical protein AJ79_06567 [Helicocarpus griseus UAMH5409]